MLRNGGCIERTPAGSSWSLNAFLMGVLTSAVILTLAFRPEWSEPTALAANDPKAATAPEKEKPAPLATAPFDLAYVPDDAMAIVAIRPKTLMKASAPLQTALAAAQPEIAVIMAQAAGFGFDIEEIDQAIAVMPRATNPLLLAEPTALLYSGAVILRSEKPIDIKGVKALGVAIQDATYAGRKYQRTLFEEGLAVAAFRPDEQTLIIASEAALFPFIDRSVQPPRGGDHPLSQAWSAIATKPIAIAVDVGSVRGFAGVMGAEAIGVSMMLAPVSPLWEEVRTHLIGVEISDKIEFETVASCASEAGAESVQATCQSLLTLARNSRKPLVDGYSTLLAADGDGQGPLVQSLIQRAVKPIEEMLSGAKVTREGTVVRYRASIKLDIAALIPLFAM